MEVERLYGSVDAVVVQYRLASVDERDHWDFHLVEYSSVSMSSGQVSATVTVQVTFLCYLITCSGSFVYIVIDGGLA